MTTERPILFSGPMVRAILEGHKTQTRRIVKPQPANVDGWRTDGHGSWYPYNHADSSGGLGVPGELVTCPYGTPGDRLWVRETWSPWSDVVDCGEATKLRDARAQMPWACILYGADRVWSKQQPADNGGKWRPSIYMPRWASRLTLEVTAVRVERLQEIDELGALSEGVSGAQVDGVLNGVPGRYTVGSARDGFAALWDAINGDRAAWASNPWVWVVEFRRVTEGATAP